MGFLTFLKHPRALRSAKLTLSQAAAIPFAALESGAKVWKGSARVQAVRSFVEDRAKRRQSTLTSEEFVGTSSSPGDPIDVIAFAEKTVPYYQVIVFLRAFEEKHGKERLGDLRALVTGHAEELLSAGARGQFERYLALYDDVLSEFLRSEPKLNFMLGDSAADHPQPLQVFEFWLAKAMLENFYFDSAGHPFRVSPDMSNIDVVCELSDCLIEGCEISLRQYRAILRDYRLSDA